MLSLGFIRRKTLSINKCWPKEKGRKEIEKAKKKHCSERSLRLDVQVVSCEYSLLMPPKEISPTSSSWSSKNTRYVSFLHNFIYDNRRLVLLFMVKLSSKFQNVSLNYLWLLLKSYFIAYSFWGRKGVGEFRPVDGIDF